MSQPQQQMTDSKPQTQPQPPPPQPPDTQQPTPQQSQHQQQIQIQQQIQQQHQMQQQHHHQQQQHQQHQQQQHQQMQQQQMKQQLQQRHPHPAQLSPALVSAPMQLSTPTGPITSRPGAGPAIISSSPGIPGQMRQPEYLVLLAPNPRQPGVQGLRYPFIPIQRHQMMTASGATILQRPALIRGVTQTGMGVHPTVIPTSQPFGFAGVQTMGNQAPVIHHGAVASTTSAAPSQMTPDQALERGTNFFNSLLTKMPEKKITIQNLIQSLIDGKKTSSEFASALQMELNSGPQLQLVPFLDLLLPTLRQSLNTGQTKIPGIRPPAMQPPTPFVLPLAGSPAIIPITTSPTKDAQSISSVPNTSPSAPPPAKKKKIPLPPGQKSAYALKKEAREARKREKELAALVKQEKTEEKQDTNEQSQLKSDKPPAKPKTDRPKQPKQKKPEKQPESLSATLRDDDDVNDVAAMGGVNLAEESQKIMASGAELVGTQIRSCKDEAFFDTKALSSKISRIVSEFKLSEPSDDIITLISHATQERLKDIVERLGVVAEHRSENLKFNPKYEVSNDIKGQMKFLAELDRIEKRRYEEQERELLLRVAKSRSKVEDPEQQKLRQKAKDMQRAEQEEVRQREANQTALLAIGPRKKLKTTSSSSASMISQSMSFASEPKSSVDIRSDIVKRTKRVNMRDLQVLLELDRVHLNRLIKIAAQ